MTSTASNTTHDFGDVILISIQFNRIADVTGIPKLALNSGGVANYDTGSGSNTLVFKYTVGANQFAPDLDYASITALTLNGGTIVDDSNGGAAVLTLPTPGGAGSLAFNEDIAVDSRPPAVSGVSANESDGTYHFGQSLSITVAFSKIVQVNTSGGTPAARVELRRDGNLFGGTGTSILTFAYTVGSGESRRPIWIICRRRLSRSTAAPSSSLRQSERQFDLACTRSGRLARPTRRS